MNPPVEYRAASLLSLLVSSHSDPALSGVKGFYPELKSDEHRLPLQHHSSTTYRERKNMLMLITTYPSNFPKYFRKTSGKTIENTTYTYNLTQLFKKKKKNVILI